MSEKKRGKKRRERYWLVKSNADVFGRGKRKKKSNAEVGFRIVG